jgi:23S rRNA pseudouridine2605 synthase/16S rRNA pseudouridine516 synthase
VGRLDMDSEGLLFLTDHGELAYRLLHPSFKVQKKYLVTVSGLPSRKDLEKLRSGVDIDGGVRTGPCRINFLGRRKRQAILEVMLTEGRKRQIRLMFKTTGHSVLRLKRTEMGPLNLGNLKPGSHRDLTPGEIRGLKEAAGLL